MYHPIVCRISIRLHPNADRLNLGTASGHQVVISKDIEDQELGLYFPTDSQILESFLEANDLFPIFDENGRRVGGGFFDRKNRKVRAQNFRGEKSDGYWCSLSFLKCWATARGKYELLDGIDELEEGKVLDTFGGEELSTKYFNPKTLAAMGNSNVKAARATAIFPQHVKTRQFRYELGNIPYGSIIYMTEKVHGTSGRYGFTYEPVEEPSGIKGLFRRFVYWLMAFAGLEKKLTKLVNVTGSRRVVLSTSDGGFYGDSSFRFAIADRLRHNLRPGEIVYGEIVGYVNDETPIMNRHDPARVSKTFAKKYPSPMTYSYGCNPGESKFIVYRITKVDEDGNIVELSNSQMRARAQELGFEAVHLLGSPFLYNVLSADSFEETVNRLVETESFYSSEHCSEGIVLRVETPFGQTYFLKDKSHSFKIMEGILKESDVVDLEEVS